MSRRNRRQRIKDREQQIMSAPASALTGGGELAIVSDWVNKIASASPEEAYKLSIELQKFLGTSRSPENEAKQLQVLADKRKAEDAYNMDQERFVEEVISRAESSLPGRDKQEQLKAIAAKIYQEKYSQAISKSGAINKATKAMVMTEPRESIFATGEVVQVEGPQGGIQTKVLNEEINFRGMKFVLTPGENVLPRSIAQMYRNKKRSEMETLARQNAMALSETEEGRSTKYAQRLRDINREYNSPSHVDNIPGVL